VNAEIIAVGSELLTPQRLDTNSLFLTGKLNQRGIEVTRKFVVGDDRERLADAIRIARESAGIVLITGGLGPTQDDLTREAASDALERKLVFRPEIVEHIEAVFRRSKRPMAEVNRRQAYVIEGAEILPNSNGTAPGQWYEENGHVLVLLPGPPRELQPMFERQVLPRLDRRESPDKYFTSVLRVAMMPESEVEQRIHPIYAAEPEVMTTILAAPGDIQIHLRAKAPSLDQARQVAETLADRIHHELGERVYALENKPLEQVVGELLRERDWTLAVAESCTGGMVAEKITAIPGSSDYFLGAFVTYAVAEKVKWLGVREATLAAHGPVSREAAEEMARGVRERAEASLGVAISGLAGPGGDASSVPVGTVFIAAADENGSEVQEFHIGGSRDRVRSWAAQAALEMIRRRIRKLAE